MVYTNVTAPEYDMILNGTIIEASLQSYTNVMNDWFVVLLFFFTLSLFYIATKDEGFVGFFGLVGSALLLGFLPAKIHFIIYLFIVLSIGMLLFKVFGRSDP